MMRWTLADTLTALAMGATPDHPGIAIERAEIVLPMIVRMERGPDGPLFRAQPPFTAFRSGFEPVAHRARLSIESMASDDAVSVTTAATDPSG